MAKMFPKNIDAYNPTKSERSVFYALQQQLSDDVFVFYSVRWMTVSDGVREMSEVDFLIFDPKYGYLTIEVKGGQGLKIVDDEWYIIDDNYERKLNKSPFDQSEKNMWYFRKYYMDQYNFPFQGTHGYMVAYPNFIVDNVEFLGNRPKEIVIDYLDMKNLSEKIRKAFIFWSGKNHQNKRHMTDDQRERFIKLVHKRIAISASAGSLIDDRNRQFELINRVQDNYIRFLENYNQIMIKGGAGTGKTWIALKYAIKSCSLDKSTLICCYSEHLKKFFIDHMKNTKCEIKTVHDLIDDYSIKANVSSTDFCNWIITIKENLTSHYDTIIIDEAQDFSENNAFFLRMHLRDQKLSELYIFYDDTQNLYNNSFGEEFLIDLPPFILRENLRNTASIYNWATLHTNLGTDVITNPIIGPNPESKSYNSMHEAYNAIEHILNELIMNEGVDSSYITIIIDDNIHAEFDYSQIGLWKLVQENYVSNQEIRCFKTSEFKGLESNVVLYVKKKSRNPVFDYVAYTRAKFYLYEFIIS